MKVEDCVESLVWYCNHLWEISPEGPDGFKEVPCDSCRIADLVTDSRFGCAVLHISENVKKSQVGP